MANRALSFQAIAVAGLCIALAVFLGYIVASPLTLGSVFAFGSVFVVLTLPFLLKWHFPLMLFSWNMNAAVFFLPGKPPAWLFMVLTSTVFSLAYFALEKRESRISVPSIARPLLFLALVLLITGKVRGGLGLGSLGGGIGGAKRYVFLLGAIIGFFAISWRSTPVQKAYKYGSAYFLGGMTAAIGNLLPFVNPAFYIIFAIFPPELSGLEAIGVARESTLARFGGLTSMANALFCVLLARYGIKGVFDFSGPLRFLPFSLQKGLDVTKPWRFIFFLLALVLSLFGGFRSIIIVFAMIFTLQFFYENLFFTKLFPTLLLAGILAACLILPFANQLPLAVQRAISFLPVSVDPVAKADAADSVEWRLTIWKRVMPEVPRYFLLGKGFAVPSRELEMMTGQSASTSQSIEIAILAGDYHNGPLSLIIPLGVWGVIGFIWFLIASFHVLRQNYRFGGEHLKNLNRFLLVYFLVRAIYFIVFFGSFYSDLFLFTGLVGLSVSLNHGVSKRPVTRTPVQMPTIV